MQGAQNMEYSFSFNLFAEKKGRDLPTTPTTNSNNKHLMSNTKWIPYKITFYVN
jgi:hypothetical protein